MSPRALKTYVLNRSARIAKNEFGTEGSVRVCCITVHGEKEIFASFVGLTFGVDSNLVKVTVLRKLTSCIYELVFGHAEELCKGVCTLFLSMNITRLFLDRKLGDRDYPCV